MGITYITAEVKNKNKKCFVKFLVDSGPTYSVLPENVWNELKLKPKREVILTLADGEEIKRAVSECFIAIPQGEGHSPVILGKDDDKPLLGAVTLENLGLTLNPLNRTLKPLKMLLA